MLMIADDDTFEKWVSANKACAHRLNQLPGIADLGKLDPKDICEGFRDLGIHGFAPESYRRKKE